MSVAGARWDARDDADGTVAKRGGVLGGRGGGTEGGGGRRGRRGTFRQRARLAAVMR